MTENTQPTNQRPRAAAPYSNPYLAGTLLGLTLLASFLFLGAGLGASGGLARVAAWLERLAAPARVEASAYFGAWGSALLNYYLVAMLAGIFLGALVSALFAGRIRLRVERGLRASALLRMVLAVAGGVLVGFTSRLARGCTSGQALSGTALLLTGSIVFLLCVFAGGYAAAFFVRREWHD